MKLSDLIIFSFKSFKNRKSRILFTVLGVAIAIASVFSLVSFGYGLQQNLLESITTEDSLLSIDVVSSNPEVFKLDLISLDKIEAVPHIARVSPLAVFSGQMEVEGVYTEVMANVVGTEYFSLDGITANDGRLFGSSDENTIVINSITRDIISLPGENVIGQSVSLVLFAQDDKKAIVSVLEKSFTILGVVEGKSGSPEIFLNKEKLNIPIYEFQLVKVKVVNDKVMIPVREQLIDAGFLVSALSDTIDQANKIFRIIRIILGVFGIIALAVAAIGLVNTMTISLLQRTNEIGIMRAIGASRSDIRRIFLGEAVLIGFMGGVTGIIVGVICSELLNILFNFLSSSVGSKVARLFVYPTWFIIFIIVLSTLVGWVAGFWPAFRAARMNPLEALRYK